MGFVDALGKVLNVPLEATPGKLGHPAFPVFVASSAHTDFVVDYMYFNYGQRIITTGYEFLVISPSYTFRNEYTHTHT